MLEIEINIKAIELASAINNLAESIKEIQKVKNTYGKPLEDISLDALATASASLIDSGKLNDLLAILKKHGADSVLALAPEQYIPVAHGLRAIGANI